MEKLDVVIFGASGFTGKYVVCEAAKMLEGLKWGVAGRNKEKLEKILKEMGEKAGKDLSKIPIIIADLDKEESLKEMAGKAKVIVNCAGPYILFGEQVVKACIEQGTHHVDVSAEIQYMEKMQLDYNEAAQEKGVYVVSACGFDSVPADMGVLFLEEKFNGCVNSVEAYLRVTAYEKPRFFTTLIHSGTWESAIHMISEIKVFQEIRKKLRNRSIIHKSKYTDGSWVIPNPGTDDSTVERSQRHFYETDKKRSIEFKDYFSIEYFSIFYIFPGILFGLFFLILINFSFGRNLLKKYPKFFSMGIFSNEGPEEKFLESTKFEMIFNGQGWKDKLAEPTDQYSTPMDKKIVTKVSGKNPAYGTTSIAVLAAAQTILLENEKMPGTGGVFSPGAAFAKTNYIERLRQNGIKFEVIDN